MGRDQFPKVIPQLDGVRAIAILLVLLCHAEGYRLISLGRWGQKGWIGVDLFFVLSGFLITGILLDGKAQPRYFRNFYGRRMLRILPVYFVTLAATFLILQSGALPETLSAYPWQYYLVMVQNIFIVGAGFHILGPTWSLAIEEHFYLVWPWLVRKLSTVSLVHVLVLIIVVSPVARWLGLGYGLSQYQMYKHTLLRLDGLAMGALIALWLRSESFTLQRLKRWSGVAIAVGLPVSVALVPPDAIEVIPSVFTMSAVALMSAGFLGLALAASRGESWFARLLAIRPLRYTGQISYALYLVHIPVLDVLTMTKIRPWMLERLGGWWEPATLVLFVTASYGLATVSWYGFESPILRLKRHFAGEEIAEPPRTAAASV